MRIAIGSDHTGYHLKSLIIEWLGERKIECHDVGPHAFDPGDDYPDFAVPVAKAVAARDCDLGIIICATGIGSCIAANKVDGIRGALCHDTYSARHSRLHNDANMLCLGARVVGEGLAREVLEAWLSESFSSEARHRRRIAKLARLETRTED